MTPANDIRQAVILIHGIGQQAPGETLRPFVETLAGEGFVTKPDRISEILEARRFAHLPDRGERIPRTDFYELYWAHRMRDGRYRQTLAWALRLLLRTWPWRVGSHLWPVVLVFQLLALTTVAWVLVRTVPGVVAGDLDVRDVFRDGTATVTGWLVASQVILGGFVTGAVSDAARYLTPHPSNVADQAEVRNEGIRLLRALHASGSYHRIVVVGHSLGSVIGYDVLRHVWDDLRHPDPLRRGKQEEFVAFDEETERILSDDGRSVPARVESYQQLQHRLWRENRERGVPWLVTDFVTLGSPLAHARLLLHSRVADLERRKLEQELPACPPVLDRYDLRSWYRRRYEATNPDGTPQLADLVVGHNGATFGPTRWTNLHVPWLGWLPGDLVGGRLAPVFGVGVKDVAVRPTVTGWRGAAHRVFPLAHSTYWRTDGGTPAERRAARTARSKDERKAEDRRRRTKDAEVALRAAMYLQAGHSKDGWPDPDPPRRPAGVPIITA